MTFEEEPLDVVNDIIKKTIYFALLPLISALFMGEFTSIIGIIYGLIISILLFRLKYIHISKALDMVADRASSYIRNRYFINYIVYFLALYTAYRSPKLNFLAVILGILLLKFVIIGLAVIDIVKKEWRKKLDSYKEGRFLK